jgi:hypothetical protein
MKFARKHTLLFIFLMMAVAVSAQQSTVTAKLDASKITVGDQARVFIEVIHNSREGNLQWAAIPDTFNNLEVVEKGRIDTSKQGSVIIMRQRLLVTGFDSGVFVIPRFQFSVIPNGGQPYLIQTDSLPLLVQTVAVDTTKGFVGIKGIMLVKSSWKDYLWWIVAALVLVGIAVFVTLYFMKNRKVPAPPEESKGPVETLQEKYIRLLNELDAKKLWHNGTAESIKLYYTELTDIVRVYIEERFQTAVLELTTDEILYKARTHNEMNSQHDILARILYTADLAKFARAQPTPAEHMQTLENAKQFVNNTKPVVITNPEQAS